MLRTLKHDFALPRILAVGATSAASVATVGVNSDDIYTATSGATGKVTLTPKYGFRRAPVAIVTSSYANVAANGGGYVDGNTAANSFTLGTHGAGSGDDGTFNALVLGWDEANAVRSRKSAYEVTCNLCRPKMYLFKVTPATPAINIGNYHGTIAKTGTGDVTITFNEPFGNANVVAVATPILGTRAEISCVATATTVRVKVFVNGSGSDTPFYLVVVGQESLEKISVQRDPIMVPGVKPRVVAGVIAYTGGVPAVSVGTGAFTVTDTGTGDVAVAFTDVFAREPIIVASPDTASLVTVKAAATASGFSLTAFNGAGAAADPTKLHFLAIGFDEASEYRYP
jgi:hypothetical protein